MLSTKLNKLQQNTLKIFPLCNFDFNLVESFGVLGFLRCSESADRTAIAIIQWMPPGSEDICHFDPSHLHIFGLLVNINIPLLPLIVDLRVSDDRRTAVN